MYSNLTLYYLDQIGIRPWIKRENLAPREQAAGYSDATAVLHGDAVKLVVFIASTLSAKARSLLQQMMRYINLAEHEFTVISVSEDELASSAHVTVTPQASLAMLVFGLSPTRFVNDSHVRVPVLHSNDLDFLIANPIEKRTAFKILTELKQLVS